VSFVVYLLVQNSEHQNCLSSQQYLKDSYGKVILHYTEAHKNSNQVYDLKGTNNLEKLGEVER
jgi:hypothetical protein